MAEYRIFETEQFQEDLKRLSRSGRAGVVQKLRAVVYPQLTAHPHFGLNMKKLRGYEPETWRFRIGAWRFFYEIDERARIVFLTAASHRGAAY